MSDDTISASDFTSAEASLSSDPTQTSAAPASSSAPATTSAPTGTATTQPADASAVVSPNTTPAQAEGPIPFTVHKTALDNARTKAVAEWRQQYGWAEQVNPQEFQQLRDIASYFSQGDEIEGLQRLIGKIRENPANEVKLRSLAARALSQRSQQAAVDQEPQVESIPIQLDNGQVVNLPTADSLARREAWIQRKAVEQATQQFQPHLQTLQTLQQREASLARQQQVDHFVTSTFQDVTTWPGMDSKEAQAAVADELRAARIDPNDPREVTIALNRAYRTRVLPNLHTASRQAVLNDINRQAAASTVNPAHTGTRAPKSMDEMSIAEALQFVAAQGR